ncbi:MAG: response regulator, partial [Phyllobacteriaceae bacterium]|nr:response regulator [Phyllobacteriaceae bacterium]
MTTTDPFAETRVAVLDGNRHHLGLMRTMLRHMGFRQVDVFYDPDEALHLLTQTWVDVVIVDLQLPRGNGIDWVRALRRNRGLANRDAAVVMTAARVVRGVLEPAVVAGVDGFLAKPMSPRTLAEHLRHVLIRPDPYVVGLDGYRGPDFRRTRERLRAIERGASARRLGGGPTTSPNAPPPPA